MSIAYVEIIMRNRTMIDYKEEWGKLKLRIEFVSKCFNTIDLIESKFISGALKGIIEYMDEVEDSNSKEK